MILDRLISAAGAVTDGADRAVRLLLGGSDRGFVATRPGSLLAAAALTGLAVLVILAGIEATDPRTPAPIQPAEAASTTGLGDRTYSTLSGAIHAVYVETFWDDNDNGIEDESETGIAWYYWLVDPERRAGVTVRSTRPPAEVYTFVGSGTVVDDPGYLAADRRSLDRDAGAAELTVDPARVIDTTMGGDAPVPLDLATGVPPAGTAVRLSGPRLGSWTWVCSADDDRDGHCDGEEEDLAEIIVFDQAGGHAVRVLVDDVPEFSPTTMTGLLRREERAVDDAVTTEGLGFDDLDLAVSSRYILDDGALPGSASLAFVAAAVLLGVAGVLLVGLAGGYLVYRAGDRALPAPATTLALGERIPLRVSGELRTPSGRLHVREAPAALVRVAVRPAAAPAADPVPEKPGTAADIEPTPVAEAGTPADIEPTPALEAEASVAEPLPVATELNAAEAPPVATEPIPPEPLRAEPLATEPALDEAEPSGPIATTLVIERDDRPHGVEVGLDHVARLSSGSAIVAAGPRPAIRLVAGTGPIVLSFADATERDRAAAEILDETGIGPDGKHLRIE